MPADADLPAVVPPGKPDSAPPRSGPPLLRVAGVVLTAALAVATALGVAALLGEGFRGAVLVEVETGPAGSLPAYSDVPAEATRFFADRDTVAVRVPRDMTVADFLALYHLENNRAAREALRDQLGAAAPSDRLREGDRVTLPLTLRRENR